MLINQKQKQPFPFLPYLSSVALVSSLIEVPKFCDLFLICESAGSKMR